MTLTSDELCGRRAPPGGAEKGCGRSWGVGGAGMWAELTTAAAAAYRHSLKSAGEGLFLSFAGTPSLHGRENALGITRCRSPPRHGSDAVI